MRRGGYRKGAGLLGFVAAVLAVALGTPAARADEAAMARFHYEIAREHYAARKYDDAIQQFFAAQKLTPNPRTIYNIGLCFLQLGRDEQAFHFLSDYLDQEDTSDGHAERRDFAERAVSSMSPRLARVQVESQPAGAQVYVELREHGAWGVTPRVLALGPGTHRIWVELEGYRPAFADVELHKGALAKVSLTPERILGTLEVRATGPAVVKVFDTQGTEVSQGEAPHSARLPPGRYELEVIDPLSRVWRRMVSVEPDATATRLARLDQLPPPRGTLTVTSNVAESVVRVDGDPVGFTPAVLPDLPAGPVQLRVEATGRLPWEGDVEVMAARRRWVTVDLQPEPKGRTPWTWFAGAVGAASLISAGVVGGIAVSERRALEDRLNAPLPEDVRSEHDRVRRLNLGADMLLLTAAVGLTVATLLFFFTGDRGAKQSKARITEREVQ
jgi:hypothetical protein